MKILVHSGFDGKSFEKIGSITSSVLQRYCNRWGYDFYLKRKFDNCDRPHSWDKLPTISRMLNYYDHVWWVDSDILIMNHDIPIESIISGQFDRKDRVALSPLGKPVLFPCPPLKGDPAYIITSDSWSPCMGSSIWSAKPWTFTFIQKLWNEVSFINSPIWENEAQDKLFAAEPWLMESVKFVYPDTMNSLLTNYQVGHLALHLAGMCQEEREAAIEKYLPLVKY